MQKKILGRRGFSPDLAGEAYDAPPDPLVGWGGETPPYSPPPGRLRRLDSRDFKLLVDL